MNDDYILEDEVICGVCLQPWLIATDTVGFVSELARITGYTCPECVGDPPNTWKDGEFPARKA